MQTKPNSDTSNDNGQYSNSSSENTGDTRHFTPVCPKPKSFRKMRQHMLAYAYRQTLGAKANINNVINEFYSLRALQNSSAATDTSRQWKTHDLAIKFTEAQTALAHLAISLKGELQLMKVETELAELEAQTAKLAKKDS